MSASAAADAHVRKVDWLQAKTSRIGRRAWRKVNRNRIADSWSSQVQQILSAITAAQIDAADAGATYVAQTLAEQGSWVAPAAFVDSTTIAGWAPDGRSLAGLLYSPAATTLGLIGSGTSTSAALAAGALALDQIMQSLMADTSRTAAAIDIASRPGVGWVRMANPPSCARCTVLAGRFYRWNDGFLRHPRCDCVHRPAHESSLAAARSEGLVQDPYEYFNSLPAVEQDRIFTQAGAQAIRDGADMSRVVNARRGMTSNGQFTTEGMGKRGFARAALNRGQRRLTPEAIYRLHPDRAEALRELQRHGYILPGGQNPLGAVKGASYEGYGKLGRGGTRVAARQAVEAARATGQRVGDRYTMTAAERRLYDAKQRWDMVLSGVNPYSTAGAPLTPSIAAAVEADYRRQLANAGQVYVRTEDPLTAAQRTVIRAA